MNVVLHSTADASCLAALRLGRKFQIYSLAAPCQSGASPVSVGRLTFTAGSYPSTAARGCPAG